MANEELTEEEALRLADIYQTALAQSRKEPSTDTEMMEAYGGDGGPAPQDQAYMAEREFPPQQPAIENALAEAVMRNVFKNIGGGMVPSIEGQASMASGQVYPSGGYRPNTSMLYASLDPRASQVTDPNRMPTMGDAGGDPALLQDYQRALVGEPGYAEQVASSHGEQGMGFVDRVRQADESEAMAKYRELVNYLLPEFMKRKR